MSKYYFPVTKCCAMILLLIYFVATNRNHLINAGMELFLLACLLTVSLLYELAEKARLLFLILEICFLLLLVVLFNPLCFLLVPGACLDIIFYFRLPPVYYILGLAGILLCKEQVLLYCVFYAFYFVLYFQHYMIIEKCLKYIDDFEKEENQLKISIDTKDRAFRRELEQHSVLSENKILEEKARISQALHDKLGHSVNGSVYQLEACKILIDKQPKESIQIIERVVDSLRESMNEIRMILREEKPDKKRMALLQLGKLCDSCREKYGINTELTLEEETAVVPEYIWEIILDNSFEAVSNALKYAKCKNIWIKINVLNKVVRCHIQDDGVGCINMKEGMGLQGMRQRLREIGGIMSVDSVTQGGYSINMILPFERE